jgi:MFS family permease
MTWRERVVDFFGLRKSIVAMLLMAVLVGLGEKMAERFLPIYLLALGGGILSVGFLNAMDNLLSALYSYPGGYLSERLGYKRALVVFNLIAMSGYLIVILFPHWLAVIIGAAFFLSWTAISLPATMGLVSRSLPPGKRTMGVSVHSLVRRIPMALGPVIGGVLIGIYGEKTGIRFAFCAALLLAIVSLVLQQAMIEDDKKRGTAEKRPSQLWRRMSPDLRNLLVSDILIRFAEQIQMVTAMLVYIPVAYLADRTTKKPFVLITFVNFTVFPLFLLFSHSFGMMVISFVIRGLKEFGEPTRKALIMDLAPEDQKAGMFGLYYLIRDVIVSGAAFAGGYLWQLSPAVNLLAAAACGLIGTIYFALRGRDLKGSYR